jgi:hypothetical protein
MTTMSNVMKKFCNLSKKILICIRQLSHIIGNSNSTIWRTLHNENMHPYHYTQTPALLPEDYERRLNFCTWLLEMDAENPKVLSVDIKSWDIQNLLIVYQTFELSLKIKIVI